MFILCAICAAQHTIRCVFVLFYNLALWYGSCYFIIAICVCKFIFDLGVNSSMDLSGYICIIYMDICLNVFLQIYAYSRHLGSPACSNSPLSLCSSQKKRMIFSYIHEEGYLMCIVEKCRYVDTWFLNSSKLKPILFPKHPWSWLDCGTSILQFYNTAVDWLAAQPNLSVCCWLGFPILCE